MKLSYGLKNFPPFQIAMEFELWVWMACDLGLVDLGLKGHVGHNKKSNKGFLELTFWHWWDPWGVYAIIHQLYSLPSFYIRWEHRSVTGHMFINVSLMMSHYLSMTKALPYKSHQVCPHTS
jgi:hypothetical protein